MHFDLPPAELHEALNALDLELESRGRSSGGSIPFQLKSASSVWGQLDYELGAGFLDTLAVNYGAGVHVVDFAAAEDARGQINDWVADRTDGKIEELIPGGLLNGRTRLVLTNAMYFAAAWTDPFESDDTHDDVFHARAGDVTVPMMRQDSADLAYGVGPRFTAVELPYDGDEVSMVVVLPELLDGESGDPLALLEAELSADKIAEITASLQDATDLHVVLPKFTFRATFGLTDALKAFGMVDAFEPELADFSPINPEPQLHVWRALHEGFIQVDEEGTRAAAATAVVLGDDSAPPSVVVDRPFLMMIRDRPTGQILFIGRVLDPSA